MTKLDLNALRLKAETERDAIQAKIAHQRRLLENLYRLTFECSPDGIVALVTCAHMSLISDGLPSEIPLDIKPLAKGDLTLRKELYSPWSVRAKRLPSNLHLRPDSLAEAITDAANIPFSNEATDSICAVINPLQDRDFGHFAKVLDLVPSHTVSAMMAHGPLLARIFGLDNNEGSSPDAASDRKAMNRDVKLFAQAIGTAIERRKAPVGGLDSFLHLAADELQQPSATERGMVPDQVLYSRPTCIQMFHQHVSPESIVAFLSEAVRVGFDINATPRNLNFDYSSTVAGCAVFILDVDALRGLEKIGLDIGRANTVHSLAEVALSRIRHQKNSDAAVALLNYLVLQKGLRVSREDYEKFNDSRRTAARHINSGFHENQALVKKYELFTAVADFIEEHLPELRAKKKTPRKIAKQATKGLVDERQL